jgi:Ankyrin repeats (3 copies)
VYWASSRGHLAVAQCLVGFEANVNIGTDKGRTPLYLASALGYLVVVQFLVTAGQVHVNVTDQDGWTSMIVACDIFQCLVKRPKRCERGSLLHSSMCPKGTLQKEAELQQNTVLSLSGSTPYRG